MENQNYKILCPYCNKRLTSNFYDFSGHIVWEWVWQAIRYKDVSFCYDKKQKCWYRKISNVEGVEQDGFFVPKPKHKLLINYRQAIIEDFYKLDISKDRIGIPVRNIFVMFVVYLALLFLWECLY